MANMKNTRRALLLSIISLLLCCSMLVGTTFAWFTDSVTSGNNIIKSGTLNVEMSYNTDNGANWTDASQGAIFTGEHWEPGHTQVRYIKIENQGNLAFKFQLNIIGDVAAGDVNLADVIDVYMIANPTTALDKELTGARNVGTLAELMADPDGAAYGVMLPAEGKGNANNMGDIEGAVTGSAVYGIALQMKKSAGNEYQNLSVGGTGFSVQLLATQYTWEKDSFDSNYDGTSVAPVVATGTSAVAADGADTEISVSDKNTNEQVATVTVPAAALTDGVENVTVNVVETSTPANITVSSGEAATAFDVSVSGIKADNTAAVTVVLKLRPGLEGVKLYHHAEEIACDYDATTGELTFTTTSFSPFTVVHKAEGTETGDTTLKADVMNTGAQTVSATLGMNNKNSAKDYDLATSFSFKTTETYEEAQKSPYAKWHADFVVSVDKDVAAESIALVGYYEAYCKDYNDGHWVALTSGDTVPANYEIRLLDVLFGGDGTGMANGFINYEELCNWIPEFLCGAADLGENAGTTLTVELRLYEVKDPSETENNSWNVETGKYITVGTYSYTFQ